MTKDKEGVLVPPEKIEDAIKGLKNLEPKINELAEIDIMLIDNIDSTNITPRIWDELTFAICDNYNDYDGFVITHGTDTMAYTSSALSNTLHNLGKPVVLTGSQIPLGVLENDARRNFVNAVKLASSDCSGVFIVFDKRIIKGEKASKISESDLDAFATINGRDIGEIRLDIKLKEYKLTKRHNNKIESYPGFESDIGVVTLTPGNDARDTVHLLDSKRLRGLIIQAYGSGNIPDDYYRVFEKALERKIPVVILTQCLHGRTNMKLYHTGKKALNYGVIEGNNLSLEAASTKLMWALNHFPYKDIHKVFDKSVSLSELMQ